MYWKKKQAMSAIYLRENHCFCGGNNPRLAYSQQYDYYWLLLGCLQSKYHGEQICLNK